MGVSVAGCPNSTVTVTHHHHHHYATGSVEQVAACVEALFAQPDVLRSILASAPRDAIPMAYRHTLGVDAPEHLRGSTRSASSDRIHVRQPDGTEEATTLRRHVTEMLPTQARVIEQTARATPDRLPEAASVAQTMLSRITKPEKKVISKQVTKLAMSFLEATDAYGSSNSKYHRDGTDRIKQGIKATVKGLQREIVAAAQD